MGSANIQTPVLIEGQAKYSEILNKNAFASSSTSREGSSELRFGAQRDIC